VRLMDDAGLRRALALPTILLIQIALILCSPLLLLAAAILSVVQRSSRPWRSVALVVAFGWLEIKTVAQLLSGVEDLDGLVANVLEDSYNSMHRILAVPMILEPGSPSVAAVQHSDGLIVLARHCGPGDSLYIARLLAVHYSLSLRVVLKSALRIEPVVGLAASRLPFCFVGRDPSAAIDGITELATTLSRGSALLLFPEGGNFSWARWRAGIRYLTEHGDYLAARRARRRTHTLPPRTGGVLAALDAAPHADVLLIAHAGFSDDGRDRQWWRVPVRRDFLIRAMLFAADDVPRDDTGAQEFLDQAWTQVDTWVEAFDDLNSPNDDRT
jgi:1-acyl-sn-glycerol-3-phosphate acyltransferase